MRSNEHSVGSVSGTRIEFVPDALHEGLFQLFASNDSRLVSSPIQQDYSEMVLV